MREMQWFDWEPLRVRLQALADRRVSGSYLVIDTNKETAMTDMSTKEIWINPCMFPDLSKNEEFVLAYGLTVHESLHLKYTRVVYGKTTPRLAMLDNFLEDQRIERATDLLDIPYIRYLKKKIRDSIKLGEPEGVVAKLLSYLNNWRFDIPFVPDPDLKDVWDEIRQEADKGMMSKDSYQCGAHAKAINDILSRYGEDTSDFEKALQQFIESINNLTGEGEGAEIPSDMHGNANGDPPSADELVKKALGESLEEAIAKIKDPANKAGKGKGKYNTAPYSNLLREAEPIIELLVRELSIRMQKEFKERSESGRLSVRAYNRDPDKPFVKKVVPRIREKLNISVIIDRSGSMYGDPLQSAKIFTMATAKAADKLNADVSIWALEGVEHIKAFGEKGELWKAKLAGVDAEGGTEMLPTLKAAEAELNTKSGIKLMIILHDGEPFDVMEVTEWTSRCRPTPIFLYINGRCRPSFNLAEPIKLENVPHAIGTILKKRTVLV